MEFLNELIELLNSGEAQKPVSEDAEYFKSNNTQIGAKSRNTYDAFISY